MYIVTVTVEAVVMIDIIQKITKIITIIIMKAITQRRKIMNMIMEIIANINARMIERVTLVNLPVVH